MAELPDTTAEERPVIRVRWKDVMSGRAYLRLPLRGRLQLFHRAGAPWSDKDPDAVLHPLQVECIARPERQKLIEGASRLGKSVLGGCDTLEEMMMPNAKLAVIAGNYRHVGHEFTYLIAGMKTLFAAAPSAISRSRCVSRGSYHDFDCETLWGARGQGYSTDYEEGAALLGNEFTRAVLGEGSHVPQHIFEKKLLRALDGALMNGGDRRRRGALSIYTTPKGYEGCSAAEWERIMKQTRRRPHRLHCGHVPWANTVWIRSADILENPAYSRAVYEHRRTTMDKTAFDEQYRGLKTYATGRVLRSYNDERHLHRTRLAPEFIRTLRLALGFDTGTYTGLTLVGIDRESKFHVLGEVYTEQRTIWYTKERCDEMIVDVLGEAFQTTDPVTLYKLIDDWVVDPASQWKLEINEIWDTSITVPANTIGGKLELVPSLEWLDQQFFEDMLFIQEATCGFLEDQIKKYIWKTMKAGGKSGASAPVVKEPKKEYDHLIDALRYALVVLAVQGPREGAPKVASFAQQWEAEMNELVHGPVRDWLERAKRMGGVRC